MKVNENIYKMEIYKISLYYLANSRKFYQQINYKNQLKQYLFYLIFIF